MKLAPGQVGRAALAALALMLSCGDRGPARRKPVVRPLPGVWHTVAAGEKLEQLAARYGVPLVDVEEINGLDRRDQLSAGKKLFIPGAKRAREAPASNALKPPRPSSAALIWPVSGGKLTSRFGRRSGRVHEGIDIAAKEGTAVLAAAAGRVIYSGSGIKGYGNLVIVEHPRRLVTVYAHNKRNLVRQGEKVRQGQVLAEVGRSGKASGYHLHFEVRHADKPVDPLGYLPRQTK